MTNTSAPSDAVCGLCGSTDITRSAGIVCRPCRRVTLVGCATCGALFIEGGWHGGDRVSSPDFDAAPPGHRWTKQLAELGVRLREVAWKKKGGWAWFVLPNGACTSMRVRPPDEGGGEAVSFAKELRVSRRGVKNGDPALFKAEAETFRKYLGCEDWSEAVVTMEPDPDLMGTWHAVALIVELSPLGSKGPNKCARCGAPTPHEVAYKENLCNKCAKEAGDREVESHRVKQEELL